MFFYKEDLFLSAVRCRFDLQIPDVFPEGAKFPEVCAVPDLIPFKGSHN